MINSREIKKAALSQLNWKKAFTVSSIFVLTNLALSYGLEYLINLTVNLPIFNIAVNIIYMLIFIPLSFGFISTISKMCKSENFTATTIFNEAILNFSKTIAVFLRTLIKIIIPSVIIILANILILFVVTKNIPITEANLSGYSLLIALISSVVAIGIAIISIPYSLSSYILADNKNMTSKEIIEKSATLMKNQRWNFIKLIISFLGWFLILSVIITIANMATNNIISALVSFLGLMLLMPYFVTSIRVFYEECE